MVTDIIDQDALFPGNRREHGWGTLGQNSNREIPNRCRCRSQIFFAIDPWKLIISESIYNLEILKREMLKLSFWNTLYVGWIYMNSAKYTCFISKQVRLTWIFQRIRKNIGNRVTEIL